MNIDDRTILLSRIRRISILVSTVLSLVVAVLFLMSEISDSQIHNSDILYLPSFFDDLWRGIDVTGWTVTPAPYFFPDFLVYGFFDSIFHLIDANVATRVDLSLRLSSAALYIINGFLFALLLRQLFVSRQSTIIGGIWVWLLFTFIVFLTPFKYDFIEAHIISTHSGVITSTFLFWILWVSEASPLSNLKKAFRYFWLFALVVLTLVSDLQFLTLSVIPSMLISLFLLIYSTDRKKHIFDLLLIGVAVLSAFRLRPRIRYQLIYFPNIDGLDLMKRVMRHLADLKFESLVNVGLFWPVIILAVTFVTFLFIQRKIRHQFYSIYLGSLFTVGAAVVIQFGLTIDSNDIGTIPDRYLLYLYAILLPVWFASIVCKINLNLIKSLIENNILVCSFILLLSLLALIVSLSFISILDRGKQSLAVKQANCVKAVIGAKEGDEIAYGISDYWPAKQLSIFGSPDIRLFPVGGDSVNQFYFWITNLSWFNDDQIIYQFAITKGLVQDRLINYYGTPNKIFECEGLEVWWYGRQSPIRQNPADLRKFAFVIGLPWSQIKQ